jgi:hypothetical protein
MKNKFLQFLFLSIPAIGISQPIFTSADVAAVGSTTTFRTTYSLADTAISFTSGENQAWAITPPALGLEEDTLTINYLNPADVPGAETVPGCNLVQQFLSTIDGDYYFEFLGITPQAYANLAFSSETNQEIEIYEEPEVVFELPLENGDEFSTTSVDSFTFFLGFDGIDSVKSIYTTTDLNEVDGWGTLTIAGDSYNVLMIKVIYNFSITTYHYIDGSWVFQSTEEELPELNYLFISPDFGGFVASAGSYDDGKGGIGTYISYLIESEITTSTTSPENQVLKLFPNPAQDYFQFTFDNKDASLMSLYDINGRLILEKGMNSDVSNFVDVTTVSPGFYFLKITNSKGEILGNQKVVINK